MRRPFPAFCAAFAVLAFAPHSPAQLELITIERPFHAHNLAGAVVDPSGAPLPGVLVEECDASFSRRQVNDPPGKSAPVVMLWDCDRDPKHILASTTTDANGRFAFPQAKGVKVHYLHLSLNGFDPMQVVVKISRFTRSELNIKMKVAT